MLCSDSVVPTTIGSDFNATLLNTQDIIDHTDSLTVMRIVGDVGFKWLPPDATTPPSKDWLAGVIIYEGIFVAQIDNNGFFLPLHAANNNDAEGSWMWRNTRWLVPATPFLVGSAPFTFVAPVTHVQHIDVPVKRILKDRQVLMYTAVALQDGTFSGESGVSGAHCAVAINLRVLVASKA